ncbi:MAG TPA: hypothetical protein VER96_32705 [Polyangiaceae bacterium]|nr:hypothetical protein [Polyangiaceae bacterium]
MFFVAPVLAQVVTLSVADRTEARYVTTNANHAEASTRPLVDLSVDGRRSSLTLHYNPSFTLIPLESEPRDLLVMHNAYVAGIQRWGHTQLSLSEAGSIGEQNFLSLALTDPGVGSVAPPTTPPGAATPAPGTTTPPATPPPGTTTIGTPAPPTGVGSTQIRAANRAVHFGSSITAAALQYEPTARVTHRAELAYLISGAVRESDRADYPVIRGPRATLSTIYRASRRDDLTTAMTLQYAATTSGNQTWVLTAGETWRRKLDRNTNSILGLGVSGTRSPAVNNFIAYSIYPTFSAGITHLSSLGPGKFAETLLISSAPAIDLVTSAVDPRITVAGLGGWFYEGFSAVVSVDSAISLHSQSELGALSTIGGGAGVAYQLGEAASVDSGIRLAYQKYQGQEVIPWSYAAFLGLNLRFGQRL